MFVEAGVAGGLQGDKMYIGLRKKVGYCLKKVVKIFVDTSTRCEVSLTPYGL